MSDSILKLAASRGIVIAISFATAPILARLFLPHAYGSLGVLSTVISIIASFASLSYVSAIPLAGSPVERRNLFVLCSIIGIFTTGVVLAGSYLGADFLAAAFNEPDVAKYALFLPLLFLATGVRQLLDTTLSCQKRFGAVAARNVLEISTTRISQIGLCLVGLLGSPAALILGSLAGTTIAAFTSGVTSIRDVFRTVKEPLHLADLRAAAVTYRKFPLVQQWSTILNTLTFGLPALLLGIRYSVEVVGLFGMAYVMATIPLQLFVNGASQVFYVEAADCAARGQSAAPATMHVVRVIALLTSLPLAAILILGPLIFELFLGQKWQEAGVFAQLLMPWMALIAISSPLMVAFAVLNRQGEGFFWNIALLAGRFLALYVGGMFLGVHATLGLFVAVSVLLVAAVIWRTLFLLGVRRSWTIKTLAQAYVVPLLLLAPAGFLYWALSMRFASLGALAIACAVYAVVIYFRHPEAVKPFLAKVPISWVSRLGKPVGAPESDIHSSTGGYGRT